MEILLNGNDWKIIGYHPWVPILHKSLELGVELGGVTDWFPATVRGESIMTCIVPV